MLLSPLAWAGPPTDELRRFFGEASHILQDPELDGDPEARIAAIRVLAGGMFDFREAGRLALGRVWDERTADEREEFIRLFADLLQRSFIAVIASHTQIANGLQVRFGTESVDGAAAIVHTTMSGRNGHDLRFDYRLIERSQRWVVRDVAIDGVSVTANYRAQFSRIIQASSYQELARQMRDRASTPGIEAIAGEPPVVFGPAVPIARNQSMPPESRAGADTAMPRMEASAPIDLARPVALVREPGPGHTSIASASAPRSEPRARPAPNSGARAYWVQVAAFKHLETAKRLASVLRGDRASVADRSVVVVEPSPAGPALARVRVGPFRNRAGALSSARDLEARGYQTFIVKEGD